MKKKLGIVIAALIVLFLLAQVIRPKMVSVSSLTPGDISNHLAVPADVQGILKTSCYDCHSDNTVWPWYNQIAPASWMIAMDVNGGRKHLNLSHWDELDTMKQILSLQLMSHQVESGQMPLKKYTLIHRDAILSDADKQLLSSWAKERMEELKP